MITGLIFAGLGWTERIYLIGALTMGVVICVSICLAGATSSDLKTGYIVGATPRLQQIGEIIGIIVPALAISGTMVLLSQVYTFGSSQLPAPQGTMIALITKGILEGNIPSTLVMVGVIIGLLLRILNIPILPVAVGIYLPLSLTTPIMVGGIVSAFVKYKSKEKGVFRRGILASSGLIAGDALTGVVLAMLAVGGWLKPSVLPKLPDAAGLIVFSLLAVGLGWAALRARAR